MLPLRANCPMLSSSACRAATIFCDTIGAESQDFSLNLEFPLHRRRPTFGIGQRLELNEETGPFAGVTKQGTVLDLNVHPWTRGDFRGVGQERPQHHP